MAGLHAACTTCSVLHDMKLRRTCCKQPQQAAGRLMPCLQESGGVTLPGPLQEAPTSTHDMHQHKAMFINSCAFWRNPSCCLPKQEKMAIC